MMTNDQTGLRHHKQMATMLQMDALIIENRRVFVYENALATGIRYGSTFAIVHDELGYHKICTKWTCKPLYNMR
jgi:hypothetical protein